MLSTTGTLGVATQANNYAGFASVGFNVGQDVGSPVNRAITPLGASVTVTFTNSSPAGSGPLRLELRGDTGGFWCAQITASPATVPYSSFNSACWDPVSGTAYTKQPLSEVALSMPGGPTAGALNLSLISLQELIVCARSLLTCVRSCQCHPGRRGRAC